jgi:hypothetical protein
MDFSRRDYRNVFAGAALTPDLLLTGFQLKQMTSSHLEIWRVPEHRFVLSALAAEQAAQVWSTPAKSFVKLEGLVEGHWFPRAQGNDYELDEKIRVGEALGQVPFDDLFMLGLERDWNHIQPLLGQRGYH